MKINEFDTSILGLTMVDLASAEELSSPELRIQSCIAHLAQKNRDYRGFSPYLSTAISSLEANKSDFFSHLERFRPKYSTQIITKTNDISILEPLISKTINNRFSMDPLIGPQKAIFHKMALIKTHFENKNSVIAYSEVEGTVIGFHQSLLVGNKLRLYEIAIDEKHRNGMLALALIKRCINEVNLDIVNNIETGIYIDNVSSMNFFKGLGLSEREVIWHSHFKFVP